MGMQSPHNPEIILWKAYTDWMDTYRKDPHNRSAKDSADYYYDQWDKVVEKRVVEEVRAHRIKETAGDRLPKVKPKADKLKS